MRNKRLIILLSVLGGLAAVVIILSAIFTIYSTDAECATTYGENDPRYQTILAVNEEVRKVADEYKMHNIFLFSEKDLIEKVNAEVPQADAYDVECIFPNKIVVKYRLVEETIQIRTTDGKFLIAATTGKIMDVRDYDSSYAANGKENKGIISVIPYVQPDNTGKGQFLYNDHECYDMYALSVIVGLADRLIDSVGDRAFDKSNYVEIDLSNGGKQYGNVEYREILIRMRGNAVDSPYGVTAKLQGGTNKLVEKMTALAGWYVMNTDKIYGGTATITDKQPDTVFYSST